MNARPLPYAVQNALAFKRENSQLIGICGQCQEEVYANRDGILRTRILSGSPNCLHFREDRSHQVKRFYYLGPRRWHNKWGKTHPNPPDWYNYWVSHSQ